MENFPTFSVIIPTFNSSSTIGKAVDSIVNGSFPSFEIIVVDDGSTDNTRDVVSGRNDSRIKYIVQKNSGASTARNLGVKSAQADLLLFLDSDDFLSADFLAVCNERFRKKPFQLAICTAAFVEVNGQLQKAVEPYKQASNFGPVLCGSYVVSKDIFNELGGFDRNLFYSENSDLFLRLKSKYPAVVERIEMVPEAIVHIVTLDRRSRGKKYSKKKYESVRYFLKKHHDFFENSLADFANFKRQEALGALQNDQPEEARKSIMAILKRNPLSVKTMLQYFILWMPGLAKRYYGL